MAFTVREVVQSFLEDLETAGVLAQTDEGAFVVTPDPSAPHEHEFLTYRVHERKRCVCGEENILVTAL